MHLSNESIHAHLLRISPIAEQAAVVPKIRLQHSQKRWRLVLQESKPVFS